MSRVVVADAMANMCCCQSCRKRGGGGVGTAGGLECAVDMEQTSLAGRRPTMSASPWR